MKTENRNDESDRDLDPEYWDEMERDLGGAWIPVGALLVIVILLGVLVSLIP